MILATFGVALGNALRQAVKAADAEAAQAIRATLLTRAEHDSELVREHVAWALAQGGA